MIIHNLASSSAGNCYLLELEKINIMIECGLSYQKINTKLIELGKSINDVGLLLVSHRHKDHSMSFDKFRCKKIIAPKDNELGKMKIYHLDEISIIPLAVNHGDEPCNAYIIESPNDLILFATDCNLIEYDLRKFKFTKVMIECNYLESKINSLEIIDKKIRRQMSTHMGLHGTIHYLSNFDLSNCDEIILMHLSNRFSDELIMKSVIQDKFKIKVKVCKKDGGYIE